MLELKILFIRNKKIKLKYVIHKTVLLIQHDLKVSRIATDVPRNDAFLQPEYINHLL